MTDLVFELFDLLGTISFAISGAMVAVKKRADLFGVLFLGLLTAVGGGILRDVLLGQFPPKAFTSPRYAAAAGLASLVLFVIARRQEQRYIEHEAIVDRINNVFDAAGLGVFSVTGVQVGAAAGYGENILFLTFLGMVTGVGGGLLRDVTVNEIPFVLNKRIYAVASAAGALGYACCIRWLPVVPSGWAAAGSIVLVFVIRLLATHYRWNLPRALEHV